MRSAIVSRRTPLWLIASGVVLLLLTQHVVLSHAFDEPYTSVRASDACVQMSLSSVVMVLWVELVIIASLRVRERRGLWPLAAGLADTLTRRLYLPAKSTLGIALVG